MTELAIVIVSWNVRDLLRRCLSAVEASLAGSGIAYRTIVVDNASADGTPAMLRAEFPTAELIESGANLGFAAGNNLALRTIFSSPFHIPYVLLLNPDTEPLGEALPCMMRYLDQHPEVVVVGPQLRYGDGSLQLSRRRFPERLTFFFESTSLEQLWPRNPWLRRYRCEDRPATQVQPVGWLVGAALLVRSSAIAQAGLLDERFFMYSEEIEWQWRLQIADCRLQGHNRQSAIAYLPAAVIVHHEGKSSEQAQAARYRNFQHGKLLLARMRYGWRFAAALRLFLRAAYCYEIASEAAKLLLGHRPALRRQRIGIYWQVFRALKA